MLLPTAGAVGGDKDGGRKRRQNPWDLVAPGGRRGASQRQPGGGGREGRRGEEGHPLPWVLSSGRAAALALFGLEGAQLNSFLPGRLPEAGWSWRGSGAGRRWQAREALAHYYPGIQNPGDVGVVEIRGTPTANTHRRG